MSRTRSGGRNGPAVRVMVVAVAMLLAGCGGDEPSGTATVEEPRASATTTATKEGSGTRPFARRPGPIEPGRYAVTAFEPTFAVTVGSGWTVQTPDEPGLFTMGRADGTLLAFVRPVRVIDPNRTYSEGIPPDAVLPVPVDLATWHARHPRLSTGPRRRTTLGGRDATRFDVRVTDGYSSPGCPAPCVFFYAPTPERTGLFATEGEVIRTFLLDAEGSPFLVALLASERNFKAAVREAQQKVLATLEFER